MTVKQRDPQVGHNLIGMYIPNCKKYGEMRKKKQLESTTITNSFHLLTLIAFAGHKYFWIVKKIGGGGGVVDKSLCLSPVLFTVIVIFQINWRHSS